MGRFGILAFALAACSYSSPEGGPNDPITPDAATPDPDSNTTAEDAPTTPTDAPTTMANCPGYAPLPGGFPAGATYRGVSSRATWPNARAACQADGGDLVVIQNAAEATAIVTLAQDPGPENSPFIWVGLRDDQATATDNDFISVRGGAAPYLAWGGSQPTGGTQDCVLVDDVDTSPAFFDFTCNGTQVYVCECLP